ncbi:MAG: FMN-binding protein [Candidatus Woesearchaeota archaeon]
MNMLKNSIMLTIIMLLAVLSLSLAHDLTQPVIEDQKEQQFYNQVHLIFEKAQRTALKPYYEDGVLVDEYYIIYDRFDQKIGYVVLQDVQGYQSEIKLFIALDRDKEIKAVRILQHEETPGIGSQVAEDSFLDQFSNKEQVDTITGATISSKAVIKGVSEALENVE